MAFPSFIMTVNCCFCFEVQKSTSIHCKKVLPTQLKGVNKGLLKQSIAFLKEKYPFKTLQTVISNLR